MHFFLFYFSKAKAKSAPKTGGSDLFADDNDDDDDEDLFSITTKPAKKVRTTWCNFKH